MKTYWSLIKALLKPDSNLIAILLKLGWTDPAPDGGRKRDPARGQKLLDRFKHPSNMAGGGHASVKPIKT